MLDPTELPERRRRPRADGLAGAPGVADGARAGQLGAAHPRPAHLAAGRRPPRHRAARLPRRARVDGLPAQPPAPPRLPRPRLAPGPQPRGQPRARRPARGPPARAARPLRAQGQPRRLERRRHLRPRDGPRAARPHPLGHHPRQPVPGPPGLHPRLDDVPHHEPAQPRADVHRGGPGPARLAAERAHHVHLLAHRRHRRVAVLRVRAGPADREHRGARQPPRLRPRARDAARHRRPARAAGGPLDAVRRVGDHPPRPPTAGRSDRSWPEHAGRHPWTRSSSWGRPTRPSCTSPRCCTCRCPTTPARSS